jgi:hypothetical protein
MSNIVNTESNTENASRESDEHFDKVDRKLSLITGLAYGLECISLQEEHPEEYTALAAMTLFDLIWDFRGEIEEHLSALHRVVRQAQATGKEPPEKPRTAIRKGNGRKEA